MPKNAPSCHRGRKAFALPGYLKIVAVGGHVPTTATHTGEFDPKLRARPCGPSARFWAKFCRKGFQRGETGALGNCRARLLPLLSLSIFSTSPAPAPAVSRGGRLPFGRQRYRVTGWWSAVPSGGRRRRRPSAPPSGRRCSRSAPGRCGTVWPIPPCGPAVLPGAAA